MTQNAPHTAGRTESPRGIETNGIGKVTTGHLNLTASLAHHSEARPPRNSFDKKVRHRAARERQRKIPYAGAEK